MYDELGGYGVLIILLLVLLIYVLGALMHLAVYVLAGLYAFLPVLGAALTAGFDALFSARLFAGHPEVGWAIGGMILGVGVGAWTIAPVYGLRRARPVLLVLPLLILFAIMTYGWTSSRQVNVRMLAGGAQEASLNLPLG